MDSVSNTAAPASGGSGAPAQPAGGGNTPPAAPASTPARTTQGVPQETANDFAKFGGTVYAPYEAVPAATPDRAQSASEDAPSGDEPERQAPPAAATETGSAVQETPGDEIDLKDLLPADVLASLDVLNPAAQDAAAQPVAGKPAQPGHEFVPLETDEAIAKAIDPTGQATDEEKSKNIRTLIGKQGRELGEARKLLQTFEKVETQLAKHFQLDKASGQLVPTVDGILALSEAVDVNALNAKLVEVRGMKLVPADWNGEQPAADPKSMRKGVLAELVNSLMPDKDGEVGLTLDEKLAELESGWSPSQKADFYAEVAERTQHKVGEVQAQTRQTEAQRQESEAAESREIAEHFGKLKQLPYYAKELWPHIQKWNERLPKDGPGALRGKARCETLTALAEGARLAAKIPDLIKAASKKGYERALGVKDGAVFGATGQPTWADHGARERGNGADPYAAEAAKMKKELAGIGGR